MGVDAALGSDLLCLGDSAFGDAVLGWKRRRVEKPGAGCAGLAFPGDASAPDKRAESDAGRNDCHAEKAEYLLRQGTHRPWLRKLIGESHIWLHEKSQ